ncbi:MAG: hypothetical protein JO227_13275 [Acetobacteraceae bacterium]|nr:hypothetical protein [Acetobacteraceae bacterium]
MTLLNLLPLFLVSLSAVGYETALTRHFAVSKWSEYGYWVISIVMVGFALSGVILALFREAFVRRGELLLSLLPPALVLTAALGFHFTAANPFNPLQLQNPATWAPQLWDIAGYYAGLLPFFFLAGLFVSLSFVLNVRHIGWVYGYDLTGAGAGAALTLTAMFIVHAFYLAPLLLIPLALSALFGRGRFRRAGLLATAASLALGEALLLGANQSEFNDFKAIYAPLHTPGAEIKASIWSPRGDYTLLADFTERVDTDISNNAAMIGAAGPPQTFGLYKDGNRIAALPRPGDLDVGFAPSALDAAPYVLIPHARVLLAGASGGFRIAEALALDASKVRVLEPEPVLARALERGLGDSPPWRPDPRVVLSGDGPIGAAHAGGRYDIIDISSDFLDTAEANVTAFTTEAIESYLRALTDGGILSIPVSIRDFPVYALRLLATVRTALKATGIADPRAHVVVYRSAWNVRVLVSREPWSFARISALRRFCDDRSFDLSWYPGIDVRAARAGLYNDLPAVSFTSGEVTADGPDDAIADEAGAVLDGAATPSSASFNLAPVTLDRPFFYSVLRLDQLRTLLRRLEILPQAEIGALVNLAVLAQAAVIAALVLLLPLAAPRRLAAPKGGLIFTVLYFPALGLGFLFIEIALIEKASFWLNDRTSGFAVVLTGMLVFSGIGSMAAERLSGTPRRGVALTFAVVLAWTVAVLAGLQPAILATLNWHWLARAALVMAVLAPVSLVLGLPFPLGLSQTGDTGLLPWAWALNGAFSVVATPLANLVAREWGLSRVLFCALLLYGLAVLSFPLTRKSLAWQNRSATSHAAE